MKPAELKQEYIRLRGEGRSYSYITQELHISKSTCTKLEQELKKEELKTLFHEAYAMKKEGIIKLFGETLAGLDVLDVIAKAFDMEESEVEKLQLALFKGFREAFNELAKGLYREKKEKDLRRTQSYLPMVHGTATDSLAYLIGSAIEENPVNNTVMLKRGTVELVINSVDEKGKQIRSIGVSTLQLLSIAMVNFTSINHTGSNKDKRIDSKLVHIPLKKFAYLCGYDVIEHTKNTEEEQLKESKRVENNLKNARKQINKDLKILFNSYIHWEEETREKGKKVPKNWDARILQGKGEIRGGFISLKFADDIAEYLINKPLTQYPVALLKLDTRQSNAYAIGQKMGIQNSMDSNISHGTANTLKVKTLLDVTKLPSIDNATVKRIGWQSRIKEPFEAALDTLTSCGLLEDWRYSHPKGVEMTDEEATTWGSFEEWAETNIYFILKDAPDHTARREANLEKKKEKREKAKAYKKKEENPAFTDVLI